MLLFYGFSALACLPLPIAWHVRNLQQTALLRQTVPVQAVITESKRIVTRRRDEAGDTRAVLTFDRPERDGVVHCRASKRLSGWSDDYDVGRKLVVLPRENGCYDPVLPSEVVPSRWSFAVIILNLAVAAAFLVWSRLVPRSTMLRPVYLFGWPPDPPSN